MHYRREFQPPAVEKIVNARVPINEHFWNYFVRSGFLEAWRFAYHRECQRPDLTLHPVEFQARLGMVDGGRELKKAVRRRIRIEDEIAKELAISKRLRREGIDVRLAMVKQACPIWVDMDGLRAIYAECQERSKLTGVEHHVDHVIPLKGRRVCGLHVPWNLQILTASENYRKSNKFVIT